MFNSFTIVSITLLIQFTNSIPVEKSSSLVLQPGNFPENPNSGNSRPENPQNPQHSIFVTRILAPRQEPENVESSRIESQNSDHGITHYDHGIAHYDHGTAHYDHGRGSNVAGRDRTADYRCLNGEPIHKCPPNLRLVVDPPMMDDEFID